LYSLVACSKAFWSSFDNFTVEEELFVVVFFEAVLAQPANKATDKSVTASFFMRISPGFVFYVVYYSKDFLIFQQLSENFNKMN